MAFAFRVGVFAFHCDMRVARLPDASVVHLFEIGSAEEIEEVRARIVPVTFGHLEFQGQKMRHHDFGTLRCQRPHHPIVMSPKASGVVLHVFPVPAIEPAGRPKHLVQHLGSGGGMYVLEIAHSHATSDIACNAVFEQLDVLDFPGLSEEVRDFFFGVGKLAVNSIPSAKFHDDVVIPEAHVNAVVFFSDKLQELHVGEVVVRDIASDAASVSRQKIPFKEYFEMRPQSRDIPSHGRIEIHMQVAHEKVLHARNLYSRTDRVKGLSCGRFFLWEAPPLDIAIPFIYITPIIRQSL